MTKKTITLRIDETNHDLIEQIEQIAKRDYRTKHTVTKALLQLGMSMFAESFSTINASGDDYLIKALNNDSMEVCMRYLGKDITGRPLLKKTRQEEQEDIDCRIIPFPKQGV